MTYHINDTMAGAPSDAWEQSVRAQVDALKSWEQASRPPPQQPTVAQTQARFVGIITLQTPQAAQELSGLILQFIKLAVDIFYILKERVEQRGDYLRIAHRMMALIETFPNVVQNASDQAEARNQVQIMKSAHLAALTVINDHRGGRIESERAKILAGHLRIMLNQLVIISRMMEELHSKVTIRSCEKAEQITTIVRNTLSNHQWDDKERIFNMHINATITLVKARVTALRELNDESDAAPRLIAALTTIVQSREGLLLATVRSYEAGDPAAAQEQSRRSDNVLAALADIKTVFQTLASQARANFDFQFAVRAQLMQVMRAMEAGQYAVAGGYAERVAEEIAKIRRVVIEEPEELADGSAGLNSAMLRLKDVTDALLRATRSANTPADVSTVRSIADSLQLATKEVTVNYTVHVQGSNAGMPEAATLAAQQLQTMFENNQEPRSPVPSPVMMRLNSPAVHSLALAPPAPFSPATQLRTAGSTREAEERIIAMNAKLAATEKRVEEQRPAVVNSTSKAKADAKVDREVDDLLAQLSQSVRKPMTLQSTTVVTTVTVQDMAAEQRRLDAERKVEQARQQRESDKIREATTTAVRAQFETVQHAELQQQEVDRREQKRIKDETAAAVRAQLEATRQRAVDEERRDILAAEDAKAREIVSTRLHLDASRRRAEEEEKLRVAVAVESARAREATRAAEKAELDKRRALKEEQDLRARMEAQTRALELEQRQLVVEQAEEKRRQQEALAVHNSRLKADEERRQAQAILLQSKQPTNVLELTVTQRAAVLSSPMGSVDTMPKPPPVTPNTSNAKFPGQQEHVEDDLEAKLRAAEAKLAAYKNDLDESGKAIAVKQEKRAGSRIGNSTSTGNVTTTTYSASVVTSPAQPQGTQFREPSGIPVSRRVTAEPTPDPALPRRDSIPRVGSTHKRNSNQKTEPMDRRPSDDARRKAQEDELNRRRAEEAEQARHQEEAEERERVAKEQESVRELRRQQQLEAERLQKEVEKEKERVAAADYITSAFDEYEAAERERLRREREEEKARRDAVAAQVRRESSKEIGVVASPSTGSNKGSGSRIGGSYLGRSVKKPADEVPKEKSPSGKNQEPKKEEKKKDKKDDKRDKKEDKSPSGKNQEPKKEEKKKDKKDEKKFGTNSSRKSTRSSKKNGTHHRHASNGHNNHANNDDNSRATVSIPVEATVSPARSPSPPSDHASSVNNNNGYSAATSPGPGPDIVTPHEVNPHLAAALNAALTPEENKKRLKQEKKAKKEAEKQRKEDEKRASKKTGIRKSLMKVLGKDDYLKGDPEKGADKSL